ncbi:MAG TPA: hypothetical protein VFE41_19890 [Acetobacteraceae bacterium]|jgi:hypothetical protein|nr:hypothetical protein [Acetobacteraceae bacterium]
MRRTARYPFLLGIAILFVAGMVCAKPAVADDCVKPEWKIDSVRLPRTTNRTVTDYVELGDVIAVKSASLADLRKCASASKASILLYLDGMPLQGLPEFPLSNPAGSEAWFTLQVNGSNQEAWNTLLGRPGIRETRSVVASLGLSAGYPLTSAENISLRPLPPGWFALWASIFAVGLMLFFWFAKTSNLLRGGTPAGGRTFSIGRSQAAWWFFIVLAAYLFIGLTTGNYTSSLNETALVLLAIAAATHLSSAAVDASKDTPAEAAAQQVAKTALQAHITAAGANPDPEHTTKLAKLNGQSQGWLIDVLSDADGIDFHRFQMLAWTFVLGVIFISDVWHGLAMPDFNATLLGLTGLSAATYIGLKIPEATK